MAEFNMFPDDSPVMVQHPRPGEVWRPRDQWPWMAGVIEERTGPDEWKVLITDPQAADGGQPHVLRGHDGIRVRVL